MEQQVIEQLEAREEQGTAARVRRLGVSAILRNTSRIPELWRCMCQSSDWRALITGYLGLQAIHFPREFQTPYGDVLTLETPHDLVTVWVLFYRYEYHVDPRCRVIVDAGANIGAFSLLAARAAPSSRIVALEPFPETRARLDGHIARNQLGDRVRSRPWALGSSDTFRLMDDSPVPSQSRGLLGEETTGRGLSVEAITLATFFEREALGEIDLLKMDIEGSEHEVIQTTPPEVLRRARTIALEYHPNAPKGPLFDRFQEAGFTLVHDLPAPHGPDGGVAHFQRV